LVSIIAILDPVLIDLAPKDIERLHKNNTLEKNEKWQKAGRDGSWEAWGNRIYEKQEWFTRRDLTSNAMTRFFDEWSSIADRLFDAFPYRKIKIQDPQIDWEDTMDQIRDFIGIKSE
jgi:hypothetical protein